MTVDPLLATTDRRDTTNGGEGFARTTKGELFIAAISALPPRKGAPVDPTIERVRELTRTVTLDDPAWVLRFDRWLRDEANLRTTTIAVACAFVHCRLAAGVTDETGPGTSTGLNRTAINVACLRADEPAEVIRYWRATYGRKLPQPVKRGVADAVVRLYDEWSALKHDGTGDEIRMGDVIELTHPKAKDAKQGALFEYLINRRHGWKDSTYLYPRLPMIESNDRLMAMDRTDLRKLLLKDPAWLRDAGWTWERLSSLGPMDADAWNAMIPIMGYGALLKNLRNFDEAGISVNSCAAVRERLTNRTAVHKSRQFPFRFLNAYKAADPRWAGALEVALNHSLENIPELVGRSLVMVDCSGSMFMYKFSETSDMRRWEPAALFGAAFARRCEDAVFARYGTDTELVTERPNVLETVANEFPNMGGTSTADCVEYWLNESPRPFDRVIVITDEGSRGRSVSRVVPEDTMLYTFNIGGAAVAHAKAGPTRHTFGGLTDQAFRTIPFIEAGARQRWPF